MAKVWITKYALSKGIFEEEVEIVDSYLLIATCDKGHFLAHYHKGEWHQTREQAIKRAEEIRVAKLKATRKLIAKLERMTFE